MSRLKRSCVVGSVVFHTLILAMLVLGPMLLAKREEKVRVIDLVPSEVIDKLLAPAAPVNGHIIYPDHVERRAGGAHRK